MRFPEQVFDTGALSARAKLAACQSIRISHIRPRDLKSHGTKKHISPDSPIDLNGLCGHRSPARRRRRSGRDFARAGVYLPKRGLKRRRGKECAFRVDEGRCERNCRQRPHQTRGERLAAAVDHARLNGIISRRTRKLFRKSSINPFVQPL